MTTKSVQYAELLLKRCSRTYGSAPCTAAINVTGFSKCYNSPRTCQDPENYLGDEIKAIRWAMPTGDLPDTIDADPRITSITLRPQMLDPGESLGVRESGTITLRDSLHNDVGFDKYLSDRPFNPYNQGTYWTKFFARWGNIQGMEFRTVYGDPSQPLSEMEYRHYMIEDSTGPDANGNYSITFKDAIKFADDEKAQVPPPSPGVLSAAITKTSTSFTLAPAGIGSQYPTSGLASIGDEAVRFTRAGDVITFTAREVGGSALDDHEKDSTFQIAREYSPVTPAVILFSLLSGTDTPAEYYDFDAWEAECVQHIGRLYSAKIMKPTPVKTLLNELIREAGLIIYTDLKEKKIALKSLRQFIPFMSIDDNYIIDGSLASKPQYAKRVSQVWTYFGKKNPLLEQSKKENYGSIYASVTANTVVNLENSPQSIKEIFSRWITTLNQPAAEAINKSILSRYETAPRLISMMLPPTVAPREGQCISVQSRIFVDSQGFLAPPFLAQVLQVERRPSHYKITAEECIFAQIEVGTDRIINVNENILNFNLRTVHDSIYTPISAGMTVRVLVSNDVWFGSAAAEFPAFDTGDWPAGVTLLVEFGSTSQNRIQGAGGRGGISEANDGEHGGTALKARYPIAISGTFKLWGGGGGGGSGIYIGGAATTGGTGAGYAVGDPNNGALGGPASGPGGDPGMPGENGNGSLPGDAGYSIEGLSYVTISGTVDQLGPTI